MKRQRIDWIDSIRGLAAFSVMICHYFHISILALLPFLMGNPAYKPIHKEHDTLRDTLQFIEQHHLHVDSLANIANYILGYWDLGKVGVALFFFVSGFVIPFSLFRPEAPLQNFAISRFFRLYPIYWVSLAVMLLLGISQMTMSPALILANFTMFQKFIGFPDINGVAWTLQIELMFYILCAILFSVNLLKQQVSNYVTVGILWAIAILFAVVRMYIGIKAPIAMPLGLSLMFIGFVWRKWLLKEEEISNGRMMALLGAFALVVPGICLLGYGENAATYVSTYLIALVLFILLTTVFKLNQIALLFLGKISYSVYLFHAIIGMMIIPFVVNLTPSVYLENNSLIFIPMLAAIVTTLALSSLTYYLVEEPGVKLGRQVAKKLLQPQPLKPAVQS